MGDQEINCKQETPTIAELRGALERVANSIHHFDQASKEPTLEAQRSGQVEFQPPKPTQSAEDIRFRTERQSLRRLPRSGAIVFTIRTYVAGIVDLAKEPGVPGRMASAIRSWPEEVAL